MMSDSAFYDVDMIEKVAVNLFYGWGYNFYRNENQVRTDDLMVRQKVSWLLGLSREIVQAQTVAYRKKFMPLPTRDKPMPDAGALEAAGVLEGLSAEIGRLESTIRTLPVPETDRMTQRYRDKLSTLLTLRDQDARLVGRAELLRQMLTGRDYAWLLANLAPLRAGLALMQQDTQARRAVLEV